MKLSFRRNQIDALLQIYSSIEDLKKRREKLHEIQRRSIFALCQLPTDFGKTAMAAAFVKHGHKENPTRKYLVVNPTNWLEYDFMKEFFQINDPAFKVIDNLEDPAVGGIWSLTKEQFG